MYMILGDIHFPVREATISGYMLNPDWLNKYGKDENPGLEWEVVVHTEEQAIYEETDEETLAAPRMSWAEFSFPTMRRWLDLEGKTVQSDPADQDPRALVAISYFETHEVMPSSTLKFVKRAGNKFQIHWEGTCDPMLGEPYDKDVPFLIQTEATFKEISVQASQSDTDATTLERLSKYLDPADFIQHPMKEIVRNDPVENRFGIIDPFLRWLFRCPSTRRSVQRYSVFEPRL
jgi:hypothetical protein